MKLFFGGSKKSASKAANGGGNQVSSSEQLKGAIDKNNTAVGNLEKRQNYLEMKVTNMEEKARQMAREKNKRGAMEALKRKKMLLTELETLTNAKMTLESQTMSMEAAQTQAAAVTALASGVKAQKVLNTELNIDKVDQIMEEIQEQQDVQNEIAQCFQQGGSMFDDDDLMDEFNQLQAEELEKDLLFTEAQMLDAGTTPSGPIPAAAYTPTPAAPAPKQLAQPLGADLTDNEASELAALQARLDM